MHLIEQKVHFFDQVSQRQWLFSFKKMGGSLFYPSAMENFATQCHYFFCNGYKKRQMDTPNTLVCVPCNGSDHAK